MFALKFICYLGIVRMPLILCKQEEYLCTSYPGQHRRLL